LVETLRFKGDKNHRVLEFIGSKHHKLTYRRDMRSGQDKAMVLLVEFFNTWTWGYMWKSLIVVSTYSSKDDSTDIEILYSWTPRTLYGGKIFAGSNANVEKRFSSELRDLIQGPLTDFSPGRIVLE
jgi:hypothetical protein